MPDDTKLVSAPGTAWPLTVLREVNEFGLKSYDLVSPPRRLLAAEATPPPMVQIGLDARRAKRHPTPADLLREIPPDDTWTAQTKRSLARLHGYFVVTEDPQRRFDSRPVNTLSHQVSLVRHVLDHESLRRVMIADEVGLGKTVEAGLLIKELLETNGLLRVLYLAPARLVQNVRTELERLGLSFRQWSALDADARWTDSLIVASIHRAVHTAHQSNIRSTAPWDVLIVDECHHLSAWTPGGGDPTEQFRLVRDLIARQPKHGRVILMSGTPHQGHLSRFENLLGLLRSADEPNTALTGRVIYRIKDEIRDWDGNLLFPRRQVNDPVVVDLGSKYRQWIQMIHEFYKPTPQEGVTRNQSWKRAAGWRCAQALQWAASSPQAGLGYLVRQAIRGGWTADDDLLASCLKTLRPYRNGAPNEPVKQLYERIRREIGPSIRDDDTVDDIEDDVEIEDELADEGLSDLLREGLSLLTTAPDQKLQVIYDRTLSAAGNEKVVLFAQPIETVTAIANFLQRKTGVAPAVIIGGQTDEGRRQQVERFRRPDGPQFLVSSRAGGEGINLQFARRLVHVDVPWNPMDMEQRVGRVHRFGSRRTIHVDTVVVKDSREEHAYRVAREKLRLIASTMVEAERFESVFSRVMCLTAPEELQGVLINEATGPLTDADAAAIAQMVQDGFRAWNEFDRRFAEQQRQIRQLDAGLTTWEDLARIAESYGDGRRSDGFVSQRFVLSGGNAESVEENVPVIEFPDGEKFACGDSRGAPVYGPNGEVPPALGLNVSPLREIFARIALPDSPTGAAHVRWPSTTPLPQSLDGIDRFGVLAFLRQTVRSDERGGWSEAASELRFYLIQPGKPAVECERNERRLLLTALLDATVRVKPETDDELIKALVEEETALWNDLRRPTSDDVERGLRHAVTPLVAATVAVERAK